MALIPGTLPSDTCYGTPQDLLELFAQYLDVPAFALNSKVVFATSSTGLTSDVIWINTTSSTNPILSITASGGFVDYVNNYATNLAVVTTPASGDYLLISQSNVLKKITYANIIPAATPTNKAFFFSKSASQTVVTQTETKCTFDTTVFNQGSIITLASSTFTPTVSGYYHIEGHLYAPNGGSGYITKATLRKNGTSVLLGVYSSSGANTDVPSATMVSGVLFFNGTSDTFELYGHSTHTVWAPGGNSVDPLYIGDNPTYGTYICGFYLGS
jgi:hypothetical protein